MSNDQITHFITGVVRINFPKVFKPEAFQGKGDPKYSVQFIFDKSELPAINRAIAQVIQMRWDGTPPVDLQVPYMDGSRKSERAYKGKLYAYAKAAANHKPQVVDEFKQDIMDESVIYSGCYAKLCLRPYGYDYGGKPGVGLGLQILMKVADGERLDGTPDAEEVFKDHVPQATAQSAENPKNYQQYLD